MIKKNEYLFQLIKSLTKEEKRNFKLFAGRYNTARQNNYIRLFNAIDKQDIYDEGTLKKEFHGETFVKQLTVTKNYLQRQIIKSLQNLHSENSVGMLVLSLHQQVAILFAKGQYELCREIVQKGIDISSRHELFLEMIGFLKWELDLINKTNLTDYKISLEKYFERTSQLLNWYDINTRGNHLMNELQIFSLDTPTFGFYNTQYPALIEKINNFIDTVNVDSLPLKARINLLYPLAQYYLMLSDFKEAFSIYYRLFEELKDEYRQKMLHEPYINTLTGLIYSSGARKKSDTLKIAFSELQQVPEINLRVKYKKAESLSFYPLFLCALNGDFHAGLTAIEIVENFLETYCDDNIYAQFMYAYYYTAYIYFGAGNLTQALKYIRKTDAYYSKDLLPNLRLAIQIMEMIIFYEQKKYDLANSRLRRLQRQIQKETNIRTFLRHFLRYFRKLILNGMDLTENTQHYQQLLNRLLQMPVKDQITMLINFDLISWTQSKLENCTFGEKIKENSDRLLR